MLTALEAATAWTSSVLEDLPHDRLDAPTPCTEWDLSTLVLHVLGGMQMFAAAARGQQPTPPPDAVPPDTVPQYRKAAADLLAAMREPGASERIVRLPVGDVPGSVLLGVAALDTVVHGWDIARSIGRPIDPPDVAVEAVAAFAPGIAPGLRGSSFADAVEVPDDAPAIDRLVGYLGRQP